MMNKIFKLEDKGSFSILLLCPRKVMGKFPIVALQQLQFQGTSICYTPLKNLLHLKLEDLLDLRFVFL